MAAINLTQLTGPATAALPVEMVERKGIGHPDTMCDALAEALSQALSRFYLERFGMIFHHNVDKALLWGGSARPAFGGGEVTEPMEIFLAGRATCEVKGVIVPLEEIVMETGREWLKQNFHALDAERHVTLHSMIRPGSQDLVELYLRQQHRGIALSNDTSCGVGFAPLDTLERMVHRIERHLNSEAIKAAHPEIGEDIKVMGVRRDGEYRLTVACAFIDRYLKDKDDYLAAKENVIRLVLEEANSLSDLEVTVEVNAADDVENDSYYITVTGTSAEAGDDGEVGRGNRVNGLITPYRPMNMEAAAGKNPVTHVGKLYNVAAIRVAQRIVDEVDGVKEAYCYLVSSIGAPVCEPQAIDLQLRLEPGVTMEQVRTSVSGITEDVLMHLESLRDEIAGGTLLVY